mgnify:CR=1 FL=1
MVVLILVGKVAWGYLDGSFDYGGKDKNSGVGVFARQR